MSHSLSPATLLLLLLTGCATAPAELDDVLREPGEVRPAQAERAAAAEGGVEQVDALRARLDETARGALTAAEAAPADAGAQVAAARALFQAADVRMLAATFASVPEDAGPEAWIDADDGLPEATRAEVLGLVLEGGARAEAALALEPDRADALLYRAMHLSLEAWGVGKGAALTQGMGRRVPQAIRAALEADEAQESAAPLRLLGRFLDRAPWPVRDREEAQALLTRAVELAPVTTNLLFLGDVAWGLGDEEAAHAAWRAAVDAPPAEPPEPTAELYRELARRRLAG